MGLTERCSLMTTLDNLLTYNIANKNYNLCLRISYKLRIGPTVTSRETPCGGDATVFIL